MTTATSQKRRVRIEGDGTSASTRIVDATTGEAIPFVQGYTVTQRVGQTAKAVIEVGLPQVSLECDAEVINADRSAGCQDAAIEAEIQAKGLTAPRVTPARIAELMSRIVYTFDVRPNGSTATLAHAILDGKFYLSTGVSACVSVENFDAELGMKIATANAKAAAEDKLWKLEGYALRERLAVPPSIQWTQCYERLPEPGFWLVTVDTDDGREVHVLELNTKLQWIHEGEPTFRHGYQFTPVAWAARPAPDLRPATDEADF